MLSYHQQCQPFCQRLWTRVMNWKIPKAEPQCKIHTFINKKNSLPYHFIVFWKVYIIKSGQLLAVIATQLNIRYPKQTKTVKDVIVSVLHQNEGGIGKSRGRRRWISQYLPSFGGVRTFSSSSIRLQGWIRKSIPLDREGLENFGQFWPFLQ